MIWHNERVMEIRFWLNLRFDICWILLKKFSGFSLTSSQKLGKSLMTSKLFWLLWVTKLTWQLGKLKADRLQSTPVEYHEYFGQKLLFFVSLWVTVWTRVTVCPNTWLILKMINQRRRGIYTVSSMRLSRPTKTQSEICGLALFSIYGMFERRYTYNTLHL